MKLIKYLIRIILAGCTAVAILCLIFACYSTIPVHVTNKNGNTDYVWPANARWMKMTEGISFGRYDANGYNNLEVVDDPEILVLGSSHMEATDVMQEENASALLSEYLNHEYTVYNQGISGHDFLKICKYLPVTLSLQDAKYVVIETSSTTFTEENIEKLLSGNMKATESHEDGLVAKLQKLPFLRLAYHQLEGGLLDLFMPEEDETEEIKEDNHKEDSINAEVYNRLFSYIDSVTSECEAKIIVVYHPTGELQEDGSVLFPEESGKEQFSENCRKQGITFLDLTEAFYKLYNDEHKLPHGFVTGEIGVGHLNRYGHKAMAQEVAKAILELEGVQEYAND